MEWNPEQIQSVSLFYNTNLNRNIMEITVNYMAIGLAVVANFILGWLWYGPLFGKAWAREMNMDYNEKPATNEMLRGMLLMVIGNFLMAYVLAHNIIAWSHVPGMEDMAGSLNPIIMTAFFTWVGFYVPTHIGATAWEKKSWKLTGINLAYHFASLFVAALLLMKM
jgi:hypothetical protein